MMVIGVLAVQGDFEEHVAALEELGVDAVLVKLPEDLDGIDGLIIPGGESTAMTVIMRRHGLDNALKQAFKAGLPVYGTCAGAILLATKVLSGDEGDKRVEPFGLIPMTVQRNAYGRQRESREVFLTDHKLGGEDPLHAVFIRAPRIVEIGEGVEVLATYDDDPVLVRYGNAMAGTFHPELTMDLRPHEYFLKLIKKEV